MKKLRTIPGWGKLCAVLSVIAFFFRFTLRGYAYLAYALVFIAALIIAYHCVGAVLWRVIVILVCIGFVYFCFVESLIIGAARTDPEPGRKYLIVLGAAVYGDVPSLSLQNRLDGAMDYLFEYPDSIAIVSGGQGKGESITEAQCMRDYLVEHGFDESRILMEDKSTSTLENLRFSFDVIRGRGDEPDGNVAIVSSSYHLYRAKQMAKDLGVEAAGVAGYPGYPLVMLNFFIREAFGVTHLWVFGN